MKHIIKIPKKLREAIFVMFGVVLVWRGIWLMLDTIDIYLFNGAHYVTGILSTIIGFTVLYYLDEEMEALDKL
jgi:hypothetical protein